MLRTLTAGRFLGGCLDPRTHCYTLEVSFFSYTTADSLTQAPYTEEACIPLHTHTHTHTHTIKLCMATHVLDFLIDLKLGKNVARTFLSYYNLTHLLNKSTTITTTATCNSTAATSNSTAATTNSTAASTAATCNSSTTTSFSSLVSSNTQEPTTTNH